MTEKEIERLDNITAMIGEQFPDFLVIVRPDGKNSAYGPAWRASDHLWAESAARKYVNYCTMGDQLNQVEDFKRRLE